MTKTKALTIALVCTGIITLIGCKHIHQTVTSEISNIYIETHREDVWYLSTGHDSGTDFELFVKEVGVGDTVVVLHGGFGAEHSYLQDLFRGMENQFHLVYYDQRGSLRSPAPHDSLITALSHVEDLERLRKELGIEKMNIFGHSMGTWVASAYLDKYPQHVNRMTLLGLVWPRLNMSDEEQKLNEQAENEFSAFLGRPEIEEELQQEGLNQGAGGSKAATYKWRIKFASASIYDITKWRDMKGGWAFYNQDAGTAAGSTMPENYDWINVFEKNPQVKITVINGKQDLVDFGGYLHGKWLNPLPNVDYHLIENAGHNSWIDKPTEIKSLVKLSFR